MSQVTITESKENKDNENDDQNQIDSKYDDKLDSKTSKTINTVRCNEIITICVGQCGIFMGNQFFSTIMDEHKINKQGIFTGDLNKNDDELLLSKSNVYFDTNKYDKYIPRSIFIDIDYDSINKMRKGFISQLIDEDNFISNGYAFAPTTWAVGHYTEGGEMIDDIIDRIHEIVENTNCPQGFNIMHAVSGGVGGGLSTLIALKLRDNYPDRNIFTYSIYPSQRMYNDHSQIFEIYNTLLSTDQLIDCTDLNFVIDNDEMSRICSNYLKLESFSYDDINWLISLVLSGITSTFRFHCEPEFNSNLRKMQSYFVPFPKLHFVTTSYSPFFSSKQSIKYNDYVSSIISSVLSNDIANIKWEDGKALNWSAVYRSNDKTAINKMDRFLSKIQEKRCDDFVSWIPQNVQYGILKDGNNHCYKEYAPIISTAISNTTAIKGVFQRLSARFAKIYKRKSYLHWYKGEGMDEMQFQNADKKIRDLIIEYQDKQDAVLYDEQEDED